MARVFLSYPSEQTHGAESIALAIRERGHRVFFDKSDLEHGAAYNKEIEKQIRNSDLMVVLVTTESLQPGRYTLTELDHAKKQWPNPSGRVLPVLQGVGAQQLPPYLGAVFALQPKGNVAAETAAAVHAMSKKLWGLHRGLFMVPVLLLVAIGTYFFVSRTTQLIPELTISAISRQSPGFLGRPSVYGVNLKLHNKGSDVLSVASIRIEPNALEIKLSPEDLSVATIMEAESVTDIKLKVNTSRPEAKLVGEKWRACMVIEPDMDICSSWQRWAAEGRWLFNIIPLPADKQSVLGNLGLAAFDTNIFLIGRSELTLLPGGEQPQETITSWEGQATAINQDGETIHIATAEPAEFVSVSLRNKQPIRKTITLSEAPTHPISLHPMAIGSTVFKNWVLTSPDFGPPVLLTDSSLNSGWEIVGEAEDLLFDASGLRLFATQHQDDTLFVIEDNKTPTSLYRLTPSGLTEFGGHDFEVISCATGATTLQTGNLLIRDCNNRLVEIRVGNDTLHQVEVWGTLPAPSDDAFSWTLDYFSLFNETAWVALDRQDRSEGSTLDGRKIHLYRIDKSRSVKEVAIIPHARLVSLAASASGAFLLVEGQEGSLAALKFDD